MANITARPHADGNRIDLTWTEPTPSLAMHVRRSQNTHPTGMGDGMEVTDVRPGAATDTGLQGETVYYYTLFTRGKDEPEFTTDQHNRVSAMATARYDFAGQMFAMLPAIYRRYDAPQTMPALMNPTDRDKGVLQRFLDLPGAQLDQLYSLARAASGLHNLDRVDGNLLPLLAQWIGWRTDYRIPVRDQRRELRSAPQIYQRIGTFAAIDATARRLTGLRFKGKEFVHNIARTNEPERLNLWSSTRADPAANWSTPQLVSVNFVYEGRPAHVTDDDGDLFVYHSRRRHGVSAPVQRRPPSGLAAASEEAPYSWDIWAKRRAPDGSWQASGPIVARTGDDKHPAIARLGDRLWLFWETYDNGDPKAQRRIAFTTRSVSETDWSEGQTGAEFIGSEDVDRRRPVVAVDGSGGLWLFWQELSGDRWDIKYNRYDGTNWHPAGPKTLPQDDDTRIDDDLFLLTRPSGDSARLWLFGARRTAAGSPGASRWSIVYRVKDGLDPTEAGDWSPHVHTLPKPSHVSGVHDREPAPLLGAGDRIELFFSTTRSADSAHPDDSRWSVFHADLLDPATNVWGSAEPVVTGAASQRAPLAVQTADGTLLTYRSSEPITYPDPSGGQATDSRYAGSTTVRGDEPMTYGSFDDLHTYTYTTPGHGRRGDGRFARDTVGLFLDPPVPANEPLPREIDAAMSRLAAVASEFLPINARAIFIARQ